MLTTRPSTPRPRLYRSRSSTTSRGGRPVPQGEENLRAKGDPGRIAPAESPSSKRSCWRRTPRLAVPGRTQRSRAALSVAFRRSRPIKGADALYLLDTLGGSERQWVRVSPRSFAFRGFTKAGSASFPRGARRRLRRPRSKRPPALRGATGHVSPHDERLPFLDAQACTQTVLQTLTRCRRGAGLSCPASSSCGHRRRTGPRQRTVRLWCTLKCRISLRKLKRAEQLQPSRGERCAGTPRCLRIRRWHLVSKTAASSMEGGQTMCRRPRGTARSRCEPAFRERTCKFRRSSRGGAVPSRANPDGRCGTGRDGSPSRCRESRTGSPPTARPCGEGLLAPRSLDRR